MFENSDQDPYLFDFHPAQQEEFGGEATEYTDPYRGIDEDLLPTDIADEVVLHPDIPEETGIWRGANGDATLKSSDDNHELSDQYTGPQPGAMARIRSILSHFALRGAEQKPPTETVEQALPFEHPLLHRLTVDPSALLAMDDQERAASMLAVVRTELARLGIDEEQAVFRGLAHPAGNVTAQAVCTYGTDRFVGYRSGKLPQSVDSLVPYRNQGETDMLTADTYTVPSLDWALNGFTGLTQTTRLQRFASGQGAAFLSVYDRAKVFTERTPGNRGGEQWRSTFMTDPAEALLACIEFIPADT